MTTDATLKAQSHAKLEALRLQALKLDALADRFEENDTISRVIEAEQERMVRVRRLAINAHLRIWGAGQPRQGGWCW